MLNRRVSISFPSARGKRFGISGRLFADIAIETASRFRKTFCRTANRFAYLNKRSTTRQRGSVQNRRPFQSRKADQVRALQGPRPRSARPARSATLRTRSRRQLRRPTASASSIMRRTDSKRIDEMHSCSTTGSEYSPTRRRGRSSQPQSRNGASGAGGWSA
jgi:hypothetical protein